MITTKICSSCQFKSKSPWDYPCNQCDITSPKHPSMWQPKEDNKEDFLISKAEVFNTIIPELRKYCSEEIVQEISDLIDGIKGVKKKND